MSSRSAPGKTAPKLLADLYAFDPLNIIKNYNVLTDPPPLWDPDNSHLESYTNKHACKHEFITKSDQSQLPSLDERPNKSTAWKVATVCKKCRLHVAASLDFRAAGHSICPNATYPLHHFKHQDTVSSGTSIQSFFKCSSWGCLAALVVTYAIPVMDPDSIDLLTNEDKLNRRYRAILDEDPERKDVVITTATDALHRLKRYTDDSLTPTHGKRQFPAHNKKFLGAFGEDCHDFLVDLGFKYADVDNGKVWQLPNPGLTTDILHPDQSRTRLQNLSIELQLLIDHMCLRDKTPNPSPRDPWRDARKDFERLLSIQSYEKRPNRSLNQNEQDHPAFGVLGALADFSDPLVFFAYERQIHADFDNVPYYFDCLQEIANGRQSEELVLKTSAISSNGTVGRRELVEAYKDLGATSDLRTAKTLDDAYLVDRYRAIVTDSGLETRTKLRQSLQKIGQSRNSGMILNVASNTVDTHEEALAYLGANKDTSDEMITALYATKVGDSLENSDTAKKAVQLIADERKSESLRGFINTGELNAYEMDLDEACRHLQITFDPSLDEDMLNSVFMMAQTDSPGKRTDQAVEAVRKAYHERKKYTGHSPESWPVGLESHGNTCYLNSLLQYYFTIKPLRDLVLNIDQYKFDLQVHETKTERVQSIHLKRYEIEAYQIFADHLKALFQRMIQSQGPRVRPDAELVCGAFLKPNESRAVKEIGDENAPAESIDADMGGTDPRDPKGLNSAPAESVRPQVSRTLSNASSTTLIEDDQFTAAPCELLPTPPSSPKSGPPEPQKKPPLPPRPNAEKPKTQLELAEEAAKRQQDVAEVMEDLLRRLRAAIKPRGEDAQGEQLDQLRDLFNMRFLETIVSGGESKTREEEDATNILLNVPYEPTDIYSALDRVIDLRPEDVAGKRVEVYRSLTHLPPLLQISVPRIALRNGSAVKVTDPLRLEETLYLDRYCENPEVLQIRRECWQMRRRLHELKMRKDIITKTPIKDMNGAEVLDKTSEYIAQAQEANASLEALGIEPIDFSPNLRTELEQEAGNLRAQLGPIEDEIKELEGGLKGKFDGFTKQKYRLYAVFFHRGGAGGGHYWTSMFDFKSNLWRDYNDETVQEHQSPNDIFNAHEWLHGTPTYAVYVRDDVKDDFVEPVCRAPEEAPTEMAQDTQMNSNVAVWSDADKDAAMDGGSTKAEGGWDSTGAHNPGRVTPQKRSSDTPSLFVDGRGSPCKRTAIRLKDNEVEARSTTASGKTAQHGRFALELRNQTDDSTDHVDTT